jgi:peptide/nickel transport system substrate-binding protein
MFWENERVDYLLEAAVATFDPEKRREMYAEIIRIVWHEAPWIFSHTGKVLQAVRHNVHGVVHHPSGTIFAWGAWIEE